MASEQSTDIILDLLYGELSADEETSARASVAQDPALAAELAEFESLRSQMGEYLTPEIPRMSVRESLLAEASKQASRRSSPEGVVGRRPMQEGVESLGFWRRLGKTKVSQLALVATVLLTGVFVMRSGAVNDETSMSPAMYEAAPSAQLAEEIAMPTTPTQASPSDEAEPAEEPKLELAQDVAEQEAAGRDKARADAPKERSRQTLEKSIAQKPRPEPSSKASSRGQAASEMKRDTDLAYDSKTNKLTDSLGDRVTGNAANSPAPKRAAEARPVANKPADFASAAPAAAEADDRQMQAKDTFNSAPGSLDAVEDAYSARDWRQVVQASDAVLEGAGTSVQKARALELKALAYQQMGMVQQALNVYKNIEANFSGYQPDRIRSARIEMERRLDSKPEPSPTRKSKSSIDFEDAPLELK